LAIFWFRLVLTCIVFSQNNRYSGILLLRIISSLPCCCLLVTSPHPNQASEVSGFFSVGSVSSRQASASFSFSRHNASPNPSSSSLSGRRPDHVPRIQRAAGGKSFSMETIRRSRLSHHITFNRIAVLWKVAVFRNQHKRLLMACQMIIRSNGSCAGAWKAMNEAFPAR